MQYRELDEGPTVQIGGQQASFEGGRAPLAQRTKRALVTGVAALLGGSLGSLHATPQNTITASSTSPSAATSQTVSQVVGAGCQSPDTTMRTFCFPPPSVPQGPCDQVGSLNFSSNPGDLQALVDVEKFNPDTGNLVGVNIMFGAHFQGYWCIDNRSVDTCCVVNASIGFSGDLVPVTPGINLSFDTINQSVQLAENQWLGLADNVNGECFINGNEAGSPGGPSTSCQTNPPVNDFDHISNTWAEDFMTPVVSVPAADLGLWIGPGGGGNQGNITFEGLAFDTYIESGCSNSDVQRESLARIEVTVEYVFCPNEAPVCVPLSNPIEVDENPTPTSGNAISINLLELVTDMDGCIDCSRFEIIQQPGFAAPMLTMPCAGGTSLGDLYQPGSPPTGPPDANCTPCTECTVLYQPTVGADFCGMDTFTFRAYDDDGAFIDCVVEVTVNPVNEPPVCFDAGPLSAACEGQTTIIDLRPYVRDPDDGPDGLPNTADDENCGAGIDYSSIEPSSDCGGQFTAIELQPGAFRFNPPSNFCSTSAGPCTISFTVCDEGQDGENPICIVSPPCTATIEVLPINQRPICVNGPDLPSVCAGESVDIDFREHVTDPDDNDGCGAGLDDDSILPTVPPGMGSFSPTPGKPAGWFTYTAPADLCQSVPVTLNASDLGQTNGCPPEGPLPLLNPCELEIEVETPNRAPRCDDNIPTYFCIEGGSCTIDLKDFVSDPDNGTECGGELDLTSFTASVNCGNLLDLGNGVFQYEPPPDFCGDCILSFSVSDLGGGTANCGLPTPLTVECEVPICVTPVNDCPIAVDDFFTTTVGSPILVDLCANDTDPDAGGDCGCPLDCSSIQIIDPVQACGTLEPDPAGSGKFLFTPAAGLEQGDCDFTYIVFDDCSAINQPDCGDFNGSSCSGEATVRISVLPCLDTNHRNASSLLLYPEYDNRLGKITYHTVTNTSKIHGIYAKFEFVDGDDCSRSDRARFLTPEDTFTFVTHEWIPNQVQGYSYLYAACTQTSQPVNFNYLIGTSVTMDGYEAIAYSMNAAGFRAIDTPGAPLGSCGFPLTEFNGNDIRNLDNVEYEPAPDEILIPRFFGEEPGVREATLVLIGLTGGVQFETTIDFMLYNDNEQGFSGSRTFECWERVPLRVLSASSLNSFLALTDNDPEEVWGAPEIESGWIRIDGYVASSSSTNIYDPAVYAVLIEYFGPGKMASDLPWSMGCQNNAALLPSSLDGQS